MKPYEIPTMNDRMTFKPISIGPEEPTIKALGLMLDHEIRHLPVVEDDRLVGIISDRDIRQNWRITGGEMKEFGDVDQQIVSDLMSRHPISVREETSIHDAIKRMVEHKIGALPVVDIDNKLVGIFTEIDALQYCLALIERY
ncbi:MAG: CBS domain-containing protein [Candidatus Manganitrophus sp.]|nr:CBS domain-containing protein [Candidatus Manganitrophus sp.]MDC4226694.1 CBS domain-containing protein [Candidatus Manganitrophus sp.]WDT72148.1 MAG: CBS domain-containing protein [Candidatus Manganitrophus sp.]WDT80441.1 MAG: CBS domain-containing protein [Candidatus Manganitrophus sp.]